VSDVDVLKVKSNKRSKVKDSLTIDALESLIRDIKMQGNLQEAELTNSHDDGIDVMRSLHDLLQTMDEVDANYERCDLVKVKCSEKTIDWISADGWFKLKNSGNNTVGELPSAAIDAIMSRIDHIAIQLQNVRSDGTNDEILELVRDMLACAMSDENTVLLLQQQ
jgi:hypothetical protein